MSVCYSPVDERELEQLAAAYGQPQMRTIEMEGDEYLFATRLYRSQDRRGEVVLAIERPARLPRRGQARCVPRLAPLGAGFGRGVLLHRKGWYEPEVYRLLSGGIGLDEGVEATLARELEEETGLTLHTTQFLGVLDCRIHYASEEISFISYVFHLPRTEGVLRLPRTEDIIDFREVPIADLPAVAEDLRRVPPPRTGWGHWRAIAHDFVYETLISR